MVVVTSKGEMTIETENQEIYQVEKTPLKAKIFELLSSPELASILLILGIYCLVFGLNSPGYGAEVLGAICLILALFGLGVIGINYIGVILILMGILFLIAEMLTPTYGVLGAASIACIILGSIMLFNEPLMPRDFYTKFPMLIGGITTGLGIIMTYAIVKIIQLRKIKRKVGGEALIGETGEVVEFSNGQGFARIHGELWSIESDDDLKKGDTIIVVERKGLRLKVKKYER